MFHGVHVFVFVFLLSFFFFFLHNCNLLTCCMLMIADSEGRTPLHWAVDRGHSDIIELLIRRNADVNAQVKKTHLPYARLHCKMIFTGAEATGMLLVGRNLNLIVFIVHLGQ